MRQHSCPPARSVLYHKTRAIGYEHIRGLFIGNTPKDQAPLWAKMAAGMSAGAIGQAIAVPLDLIKVQTAARHYSIYPSPRLILLAIAALIFVRFFFGTFVCVLWTADGFANGFRGKRRCGCKRTGGW